MRPSGVHATPFACTTSPNTTAGSAVERDAPQLAGNDLGRRVEHGEAQRAGVDAPGRVGAQIVPSGDTVDVEHGAGLVAFADVLRSRPEHTIPPSS